MMIDRSLFNSQFQMVIYDLIFKLLEKYMDGAEASPTPLSVKSESSTGSATKGGKFEDIIQQASEKYKVDVDLIRAVIKTESGYNPKAVSHCGAMGLMQLMPGTAKGLGVTDPFDPKENIFGGVKLLHRLLGKYKNNISLALAAYNAGSGAVDRYGGIPPYQETQTYIKRVMGILKSGNEWSR